MGLSHVDIRSPYDREAERWLDRYEEYSQLAAGRWHGFARVYSWMYEPLAWVGAVAIILTGFFAGGWLWVVRGIVFAYWVWLLSSTPRVVREYEKLRSDRRVLRVPEILLELYAQSMRTMGEGDTFTDEDRRRRFLVLGDIIQENSAIYELVANDCGCKVPCSHVGRLEAVRGEKAVTRGGLHRRLRRKIAEKLQQVA